MRRALPPWCDACPPFPRSSATSLYITPKSNYGHQQETTRTTSPKFDRCWPTMAETTSVWSNASPGKSPTKADIKAMSTKVPLLGPVLGNIWPKSGRHCGRTWADFGRRWARIRPHNSLNRPKLQQGRPNLVEPGLQIRQRSGQLGPNCPNWAESRPTSRRHQARVEQERIHSVEIGPQSVEAGQVQDEGRTLFFSGKRQGRSSVHGRGLETLPGGKKIRLAPHFLGRGWEPR